MEKADNIKNFHRKETKIVLSGIRGRFDLGILFLVFLFLYSFSPTEQSVDSLSYLSGITNDQIQFHPHHLTYMAIMQWLNRLAEGVGLTDQVWFVVHMTVLLMSAAGLVFCAWFFESLGCPRKAAVLAAATVGLSGTLWQFAGQFECYGFLFGVTALLCAAVAWSTMLPSKSRMLTAILMMTGPFLAFATTLHQGIVLMVPALAAFTWQRLRPQYGFKTATLAMLLFIGEAGLLSLGTYIIVWKFTYASSSFQNWLTMYASMNSAWGDTSRFSLEGFRILLQGWGGLWFNMDPLQFYQAPPIKYAVYFLAWAVLFLVLLIVSFSQAKYRKHLIWISLWLLLQEGFLLWWTPWLRSMHTLALIPQGAIVAMAFGVLAKDNESNRARKWLVYIPASIVIAILICVNWVSLVRPGLRNTASYLQDLTSFERLVGSGDSVFLEINHVLIMKVFAGVEAYDLNAANYKLPAWATRQPDEVQKRIIVHSSSFMEHHDAPSAFDQYTENWDRLLQQMKSSSGGADGLKGRIVPTRDGSIYAVEFGVENLPLSYNETLAEIAEKLKESYPTASAYFYGQVPSQLRNAELLEKQKVASGRGTSSTLNLLEMPWIAFANTATAKQTSGSFVIDAITRDPILINRNLPINNISLYSKLRITAQIHPPADKKSWNKEDYNIEFFFQFGDHLNPSHVISIPWNDSSQTQTAEVNLWDYLFLTDDKPLRELRFDPGSIPGAHINVTRLEFAF